MLELLQSLPSDKQQPNLVFAAVRRVCGLAQDGNQFCEFLQSEWETIKPVILQKSTQTNEPGRCAVLLPALCQLPQPLALLEVGAAAGLCLFPDKYGYQYGDTRLEPPDDAAPIFYCACNDNTPIPKQLPHVVWRGGIDLNPLDLTDDEDVSWLKTLVWPEQTTRAENLDRAIRIARGQSFRLVGGNLFEKLTELASEAPKDATLVIFHSAVFAYIRDIESKNAFPELVAGLGAEWIVNESPKIFPEIEKKVTTPPTQNQFLLSLNGTPLATTGPHGQSIHWL